MAISTGVAAARLCLVSWCRREEMVSHGLADIFGFLDHNRDHRVTMQEYANLYKSRDAERPTPHPVQQEQPYRTPPIYPTEHQAGSPDMAYAPGEDDHHMDPHMATPAPSYSKPTPMHYQPATPQQHDDHHITASMWPEANGAVTVSPSRSSKPLTEAEAGGRHHDVGSSSTKGPASLMHRLEGMFNKMKMFEKFQRDLLQAVSSVSPEESAMMKKSAFLLFDSNGDGGVTLREFAVGNHVEPREIQQLFDKLDQDHNDALDIEEMFPLPKIAPPAKPAKLETKRSEFDSFDLDGNDVLDSHELKAGKIEDLLEWADTDHDGDISLREYMRTKTPEFALQHQKQVYMSIDDDRDGRVTRYEFLRHVPAPEGVSEEKHIADTDKNGDGNVVL